MSAALETFKDRSSLVWGGGEDVYRVKVSGHLSELKFLSYLGVKPGQKGSEVKPGKGNLIYCN